MSNSKTHQYRSKKEKNVKTLQKFGLQPPANVEAVIRNRLGYLDREARDMLAYGSVEGEQFTTLVLSRLLDIKPLSLIRQLRAIEVAHHLIASLGLQSLDRIVNPFPEANNLRIDLLLSQGQVEDFTGAQKQALGTYRQAESLARERGENARLARILNSIAPLLRHLGEYDEAQHCYEQSAALAEQTGDRAESARAYYNLGYVHERLSVYDRALACHRKSLSVWEALDDKASIALSHSAIGPIYNRQGLTTVSFARHKTVLYQS